jgi:hypothetical protein
MNSERFTNETEMSADEMRRTESVKSAATMEDVAREFEPAAETPAEAIARLKSGKARFFSNQTARPPVSALQRRAQIAGQPPFAVVKTALMGADANHFDRTRRVCRNARRHASG